jgi:hypothetical protein
MATAVPRSRTTQRRLLSLHFPSSHHQETLPILSSTPLMAGVSSIYETIQPCRSVTGARPLLLLPYQIPPLPNLNFFFTLLFLKVVDGSLPMETVEEQLRELVMNCIQECNAKPLTNLPW